MAATVLAAQTIQLGINDVVVAGGMESMSNAPKYITEARSVRRLPPKHTCYTYFPSKKWVLYSYLYEGDSLKGD